MVKNLRDLYYPVSYQSRIIDAISRTSHKRKTLFNYLLQIHAESSEMTVLLGCFYRHGIGTKADLYTGIHFFAQAAAQKDQLLLGNLYYYDYTSTCNDKQAYEFFSQSAESGNVEALYGLAGCFYDRRGVKKNPVNAYRLYLRATDKGHVRGIEIVALCYKLSHGTNQDIFMALRYHRFSPNKSAQILMGSLHDRTNER